MTLFDNSNRGPRVRVSATGGGGLPILTFVCKGNRIAIVAVMGDDDFRHRRPRARKFRRSPWRAQSVRPPKLSGAAPSRAANSTTTMIALAETRQCSKCRLTWPVEEFRFRSRAQGVRHRRCRRCTAREAQRRRKAKRNRAALQQMQAIYRTRSHTRALMLSERLIAMFGGPDAMFAWFWAFRDDALREGKEPALGRCWTWLFRVNEALAASRHKLGVCLDEPDEFVPAAIPGEQLHLATVGLTLRIMEMRPDFAEAVVTEAIETHPELRPAIRRALDEVEAA